MINDLAVKDSDMLAGELLEERRMQAMKSGRFPKHILAVGVHRKRPHRLNHDLGNDIFNHSPGLLRH